MYRPVTIILSFSLFAFGIVSDALSAKPSLQIRDLRVTFPTDNEVRIEGEMQCNELMPDGMASPDSNIEVNIDFPRGSQGFARLPEHFMGYYTDPEARPLWKPYYEFEGKRYVIAEIKPPFYNSTHLRWNPVLDKALDNYRDDGQWIGFAKTLRFRNLGTASKLHYRVVLGWKHSYLHGTGDQRFAHKYYWVVYGPFAWGTAPVCDANLTASFRQPVSFTERGVERKRPVKMADPDLADERQGDGQATGETKREKLVRKSGRPSQLEAVNASQELEKKLMAMPIVQTAGVRVTPRSATIAIGLADDVKAEAVTKLLVEAAVESAYALSWISSMEITVRGTQGSSTITVNWDDVSRFVADELSVLEFFKTWSVQGEALVSPDGK